MSYASIWTPDHKRRLYPRTDAPGRSNRSFAGGKRATALRAKALQASSRMRRPSSVRLFRSWAGAMRSSKMRTRFADSDAARNPERHGRNALKEALLKCVDRCIPS